MEQSIRKAFLMLCMASVFAAMIPLAIAEGTATPVPAATTPMPSLTSVNLANFSDPTNITNQYSPMKSGTRFIYKGYVKGHDVEDVIKITDQTKVILGITTVVVRDTEKVNGKLTEDTFDWYAQDNYGNVWYFGEYSTQYKNDKVIGHEGSWEAGVNGALPGIVMEGNPQVGDIYNQEFAPGVAEDMAQVLSLSKSLHVPFGRFDGNVLLTKEFSPLEPGVVEHKYYAPGVGLLKAVDVTGGREQIQLVAIQQIDI